jgi:hypothetical protein
MSAPVLSHHCRIKVGCQQLDFTLGLRRANYFSRREHRCRPGHHRPGCGGSTPPSCRVRVANFDIEVPALNRRERGAIPRQPTNFNAPVAQSLERDASNVGDEGESPAGGATFTGMWFNPNSRGSRLRIWQPWGCKSLHAHHFTATGFSGNSRPRRLKIAEPSGCKSRVADQPSLAELWLGKPACG